MLCLISKDSSRVGKAHRIRDYYMCYCGNFFEATRHLIKSGKTKSCGCFRSETTRNLRLTHNRWSSPEYKAYHGIKKRCYNKKCKDYSNYGGRGIKMCDRWLNSFENFYKDMGDKPKNKDSIDRIDNEGNYEPSNCRWATYKEQANNTRRTSGRV